MRVKAMNIATIDLIAVFFILFVFPFVLRLCLFVV